MDNLNEIAIQSENKRNGKSLLLWTLPPFAAPSTRQGPLMTPACVPFSTSCRLRPLVYVRPEVAFCASSLSLLLCCLACHGLPIPEPLLAMPLALLATAVPARPGRFDACHNAGIAGSSTWTPDLMDRWDRLKMSRPVMLAALVELIEVLQKLVSGFAQSILRDTQI